MSQLEWNEWIREYRSKWKNPKKPEPISCRLSNGNTITLRPEEPRDFYRTEDLTRQAFWNKERAEKVEFDGLGCDEHYLVHILRSAPEFLPELDIIAEHAGKIIGNIIYSLAFIQTKKEKHAVLTFGPLSVLPEYQKTGVGSALMRHTIELAKQMGFGAILIYGHPTYYPRFGFAPADKFGVTTADGKNFPAFMGLELIKGDLLRHPGFFYGSPLFQVDLGKAKEFDRQFCRLKS